MLQSPAITREASFYCGGRSHIEDNKFTSVSGLSAVVILPIRLPYSILWKLFDARGLNGYDTLMGLSHSSPGFGSFR